MESYELQHLCFFLFLCLESAYAIDLRAGAAAASPNPPAGTSLAGYGSISRRNISLKQHKYAHCFKPSKGFKYTYRFPKV